MKATDLLSQQHKKIKAIPKVAKAIDAQRLSALGKEMKARFLEARKQGHEALLAKGPAQTAADSASTKLMRARTRRRAA